MENQKQDQNNLQDSQLNQKDETSQQVRVRQIGNYILGQTIGQGTFGKVKLATHVLTDEKVAIKILEKSKIADASDVERVTREIQILRMIRHGNIIQLYEIIETPKQLYLVMEYATSGELFDYIVQNKRIKDLEGSIEYLHKINIVHRDLKPENLLIDHNKTLKIVDFGLSNMYKSGETLKTACGSPCYAAPEMISGKRYKGLQVDIWSCGVILFAMLCGYLPFEDSNTANLYKKIINGDYKIPKFVSPEGKDLITKILNTDPNERYTIDDIKRHPWFNLCRSQASIQQGMFYPLRPQNEGIIVGKNVIPIDYNILKLGEEKGFQRQQLIYSIQNNKHNSAATTFYLLLKKYLRAGGKSIADITSETFRTQLIEKEQIRGSQSHEPRIQDFTNHQDNSQNTSDNKIVFNQTQYITVIDNSIKINKKEPKQEWKADLAEQLIRNQNPAQPSSTTEHIRHRGSATPSKSRLENNDEYSSRNNHIRKNNIQNNIYIGSNSPPQYNFPIKQINNRTVRTRDASINNQVSLDETENNFHNIITIQPGGGNNIRFQKQQPFSLNNNFVQPGRESRQNQNQPPSRAKISSMSPKDQFLIKVNHIRRDRGASVDTPQEELLVSSVNNTIILEKAKKPQKYMNSKIQPMQIPGNQKLNQTGNFKRKAINYFNI